jgi:CheY-like chemotaxis protein
VVLLTVKAEVVMAKSFRVSSSVPEVDMSSAMILSVGLNAAFLSSRASFLVSAGYLVISALSVKEAIRLFQVGGFDLIVLCHSIPHKDRERLTCLIRASGSFIPVVSVTESPEKQDAFPDATLGESDPAMFLTGIRKVLGRARKEPPTQEVRLGKRRDVPATNTGLSRLLRRANVLEYR